MPGGKYGNRATYDDDDWEDYEENYDEEYAEEEDLSPAEAIQLHKAEASEYKTPAATGSGEVDDMLSQLIPGFSVSNSKQKGQAAGQPKPQQQLGVSMGSRHDAQAGVSGSALAYYLSGPPPLRPSGKFQKAGRPKRAVEAAQQAALAPPAHPAASDIQAFQFDQPSPDDIVHQAQTRAAPGSQGDHPDDSNWLSKLCLEPSPKKSCFAFALPNVGASSPAAVTTQRPVMPTYKPVNIEAVRDWQSEVGGQGKVELDDDGWQKIPIEVEVEMMQEAAAGLDGTAALQVEDRSRDRWWKGALLGTRPSTETRETSLRERARLSPASRRSPTPERRRPLSEYVMETDLKQKCDEAAEREQAADGGRTKLHLVVLGHVDAGKSTLMGRLLHELGCVSQKVVYKHQKEAAQMGKASFAWAWLLDERPQERARGVTIDVASAHFETPSHVVTLLDAPGHRDFVPNMIAGAAQADAALLLVDGSKGNFEAGFEAGGGFGSLGGGQTREHAQLARSLGVSQLAVVISKLDTCGYSEARFEEIKAQLLPFLKQCGFKEGSLQWLPAVGTLNQNLTCPATAPELAAWWKGPTLVDAIDAFMSAQRMVALPLRLPINDVFKGDRGGQSVGGKLEAGAIKVGTQVKVMPSGEKGTIKSIEIGGQAAALARAGDSADVTLANIDAAVLGAGAVICHPEFPVPLASRVEARVVVLDVAMPIVRGQQVTLHAHAARETGHVSQLLATVDPKTGELSAKKPRVLTKGQSAVVEVTVSRPTCLELYSDCRALGRLVLREGGQTVAVGIVTAILD